MRKKNNYRQKNEKKLWIGGGKVSPLGLVWVLVSFWILVLDFCILPSLWRIVFLVWSSPLFLSLFNRKICSSPHVREKKNQMYNGVMQRLNISSKKQFIYTRKSETFM